MVNLQTLLKIKGNGVKMTDPVRNKLRMLRLFTAVKEGRLDVVRALVELGVDIRRAEGADTGTVAAAAATAMEVSSRREMVNQPSFLLVACEEGHVDIFRYLLEKGADVNQRVQHGQTVLHIAASRGKLAMVRCACESGAAIDVEDVGRKTALMHASERGHHDVARYLVGRGADIHATDKMRRTALHLAVAEGYLNLPTVRCLVESGARIDSADAHGRSCVSYACEKGFADILAYLVSFSPELDARATGGPRAGDTALHTIFHYYSHTQSHTFPRAIVIDTLVNMCKILIRGGAHYDIPDRYGRTFLDFIFTKGFLAQGSYHIRSECEVRLELISHLDLPLTLTCLASRACRPSLLKSHDLPRKITDIITLHKPFK